MRVQFRPLPIWPHEHTRPRRSRYTFKAAWSDTLSLLDRELQHLGAEAVVIQADFAEADIRLDGMPRANARVPSHPGVIVSFESKVGPLQYATDAHEWWQHNVRAIALGLEALRKVDRYGITRNHEQYTGWKQLTAGDGSPTSAEQARLLLQELTGWADVDPSTYRLALKMAHPDHGGSTEKLMAVREAGRLLGVA